MNKMMNRLLRLQALNRNAPREYRIEAREDSNEVAVYLYDIIGYDWWTDGGVTAKQFARDLAPLNGKTIHLHINSPGGDVFEGRAMVAALKKHEGRIIVHIDGIAASAASFIAMHGDEIEITQGAFVMIHNGWTFALGNRHDLRETADLLEKVDGSIVDDYMGKVNAERSQVEQWMDDETYFTAAEAVEHGFANRIAGGSESGTAKARTWNLSAYDRPPAELQPEAVPEVVGSQEESDQDLAHAHRFRALAVHEKKKSA
ncbi:hypothetical protein ARC78_15235 [Stenotrophomonas pictorum JCM 9942]|uniref:ATP-dependent Clp protease proteolytic subunit n=1 Tax=Stenotrophomonas pictorum JCM 9942 TaxID=1236960 RepID=A0A0R0AAF0_9GAMM|nr:head maturation protease, ClpP-related [Stenotrophomonas pictorum]KRG38830.1 hypothetical protein ARC78_15235 [Stenotrophomonas pictorum JCM 9942]